MEATAFTSFEQMLDAVQSVDVHALDDVELRDALVAAERVRNATEALQGRMMVAMRDRAHSADVADSVHTSPCSVPTGSREEFVVDEIALHLRCTKMAASHRFAVALSAHQHAPLRDGWAEGHLDARKVEVVGELLIDTDPVLADTLAAAAVAYATSHSSPQLRAWLSRRVMTADPAAAEQRRERATAGRRVALVPLPDGVAELSACMPSVQARLVYDTLTALAHASDSNDARTLDQRRSDALYDLVTGRAAAPRVTLNVTVPMTSVTGAGRQPGELAGVGPMTAEAVREAIGVDDPDGPAELCGVESTPWRRLLTDPRTGILLDVTESRYRPSERLDRAVRTRDLTCRFPGCRRPATTGRSGVDLDHVTPWPRGSTSAVNLACLCRHHHRLKHSPGWRADLQTDGTLRWTTPTGHRFTTAPWRYTDPSDERGGASGQLDDAA